MKRTIAAAAAVLVAVLAVPATAAALNVYAAASLREALPALDRSPSYNFAGSNQLQLQIERGGPADLFLSASPEEAQALFRAGRCERPQTFATNRLVIMVPSGNPGGVRSAYSLRSGRRRLAVGTAGVPVGAYTRLLLRRMRLSSILQTNTVTSEPNVTSLTAKVALRSVDAGFAYVTDARSAADRVDTVALPRWAQPPVRYQACVVRRSGADANGARRYLARLRAGQGRTVLKRYGFGLPPRA